MLLVQMWNNTYYFERWPHQRIMMADTVRSIHMSYAFPNCCGELRGLGRQLAGECLYTNYPPEWFAKVHVYGSPRGAVGYQTRNRLTEVTAFELLHLLHHLGLVCSSSSPVCPSLDLFGPVRT